MKNKKFFTLLFMEIIVLLGIAAYFLIDSASIYKYFFGDIKYYEQSKDCDLHVKSCSANIPTVGRITFDVEPKDIPLMAPLTFTATTDSEIDKDALDLHVYATNMNMGYYNLKMRKISTNKYQVKATLPSCVVGGMIWRADVALNHKSGGFFIFKTK